MTVGRNPLQGSLIQPRTTMANVYRWLVSIVLIFVSVSVTQVSSEKVAQATDLTCAQGGVCVLGNIGPGGGKVFYVAPTTFASPGSACDGACKYLEVAPSSAQRTLRWASTSNETRSVADNATNTAIGTGMANTIKIANQSGNISTDSAAVYAYEYLGGGKEDWHLPSFEELKQLFTNQSRVESGLKDFWWSSSESSSTNARRKHLLSTNGGEGTASKSGANHMRPVRAFASVPTLTVTYNSQGGSAVSAGSTTSGGSISASPGTPTRTDYTFNGWFVSDSSGTQIQFPYTHGQTANFTLYAQWTATTLNVTYNSQGGSAVSAGSTTSGGTLSSLPTTSREGYIFIGWFTASSGGSQVTISSPHGQTADFTLYAKWTANSLTVTYDSREGSSATGGSLSTTTGGTLSSLPTTSREGYIFNGWFTAASGGSQVTASLSHGQTASFTLYAQWTIRTYAVSFDGNGSTVGSVPVNQTKTHGIDIAVASNSGSLVKTGYTFDGWNTAADGLGTSYAAGASYGVDAAETLYAKWTANPLRVTYNSQSGSAVSAGLTTSGGVIASAPVAPTRTGSVFTGWFVASTGGSAISFPYTHGRTADFTLYAQWSVNTYVVSFDGNDSTGGSVPVIQTKTHGIDIAVASNSGSLVKTGYTFGGWNTHADGSGTSFLEGATYGVDGSLSLLAVWLGDALTVTYNSQSGSAVSAGSTTSGGVIASAPVAPTRTGYVFTGWFTASRGGSAISFPYTHGQTASFTLHAQWSQASLHGISSVSKIGTITTTANVGNTFAVDTESSSVSLRYPANGLPADTVIDVYLVNDLSRARSLVAPAGGFVVSLVVAWLAADGSVPLMASGKPLSMTIANDTIKAGAKTYAIVGGEVTLLGTASVNGSVTISITEDPEIVVVNPVVVAQPSSSQPSSSQPSSSQPASSARRSPVKVVESLPQIPGATSKIAGILNTVGGKLPPKPTVFAPKILSNGQIARIAFTPIQIKAPPANAPVAPLGAKVFPIGAKIEQSQVTPTAPVSRVAAGESKATFGGKTIETEMSKVANGPAILSAGPATIALAGFANEPSTSNGGSSGSKGLTASSSTPLEIATGSFIASTPVQVWLFSTPLLLAEAAVDENGNFAAAISLPSSLPAGDHTLQIQGFVYAAGGAAEVTANIGVSIAVAAIGTRWSGTFPMYVASITPSVKSNWTKFVSAQNSKTLSCIITPVKPERNSKVNIRLYENRLISMTTMLKYNGCDSVETLAPSAAKKSSVANRTWAVKVQSQASTVAFRWVHDFATYASTINPAQKATWTALSTDFVGQKLQCVITGSEPIRKSTANLRIFERRNENLKAYLLNNDCSEVVVSKAISAKTKLASRTKWRVDVSLTK